MFNYNLLQYLLQNKIIFFILDCYVQVYLNIHDIQEVYKTIK
jgi:hypothetical protein